MFLDEEAYPDFSDLLIKTESVGKKHYAILDEEVFKKDNGGKPLKVEID